jgi:type III secretory pathway component EscR
MLQACYTVGGLSISAAEIEFVILKMKAPVHRPQLVLLSPSFATSSINYTIQNGFYLFYFFSVFDAGPSQIQNFREAQEILD